VLSQEEEIPVRRRSAPRRDDGAIAVIVAIVLAFALMPAIALGTGTYVRSTTSAELNRASDTGALAGAAEIPLGNLTFAGDYLNQITGSQLPGTTLQQLGISDPAIPDPLQDACKAALRDAQNSSNLGHAYAGTPTCSASYIPQGGALTDLQSCINGETQGLLGNLGGLLGGLGLGGLDPAKVVADLSPLLPALLTPGVKLTMSWKVKGPLDQIFSKGDGNTQTVTSVARRRFKNMVVLPVTTLGGTTINVDPTLQNARTMVLNTLTQLESVLNAIPLVSSCTSVITDLQGDIADAVDPPSGGPSLNSILNDAVASNEPILAVVIPKTLSALQIPFLDVVPVCMASVNGAYVAHLTSFGTCVVGAPGGFRASLRNS
jgi:hypothetical protein